MTMESEEEQVMHRLAPLLGFAASSDVDVYENDGSDAVRDVFTEQNTLNEESEQVLVNHDKVGLNMEQKTGTSVEPKTGMNTEQEMVKLGTKLI